MAVRVFAAGALAGVLAAPTVLPAFQAPTVVQTSYDCILANQPWQVGTGTSPSGPVSGGRVLVRTAISPDYFYAVVGSDGVVRLPGPLPEARYVSYYTELTLPDGNQVRSGVNTATVVRDHASCNGSMAPTASAGSAAPLHSLAGTPVTPPGFAVSGAPLTGGEVLPRVAAGSGGGSFFGSRSFLVGLGALATGVVAGVVIDDDSPASPSR